MITVKFKKNKDYYHNLQHLSSVEIDGHTIIQVKDININIYRTYLNYVLTKLKSSLTAFLLSVIVLALQNDNSELVIKNGTAKEFLSLSDL